MDSQFILARSSSWLRLTCGRRFWGARRFRPEPVPRTGASDPSQFPSPALFANGSGVEGLCPRAGPP
eukprot:9502350-Pyramimonas_sp.AAC.1